MKKLPVIIIVLFYVFFTLLINVKATDYNYDVSGSGDSGYVNGNIDANSGTKEVDGYITTEDGEEKHFDGEWTGKGVVEGDDEDGEHYELEVE